MSMLLSCVAGRIQLNTHIRVISLVMLVRPYWMSTLFMLGKQPSISFTATFICPLSCSSLSICSKKFGSWPLWLIIRWSPGILAVMNDPPRLSSQMEECLHRMFCLGTPGWPPFLSISSKPYRLWRWWHACRVIFFYSVWFFWRRLSSGHRWKMSCLCFSAQYLHRVSCIGMGASSSEYYGWYVTPIKVWGMVMLIVLHGCVQYLFKLWECAVVRGASVPPHYFVFTVSRYFTNLSVEAYWYCKRH